MEQLQRTTITPTDEKHWLNLRRNNINSTEIAALFGLSPFKTYAEVWLSKRDNVEVEFKNSKRIKAGQVLEPAIARLIADDNGWDISPFKNYIEIPSERIGSSFDFCIKDNGAVRALFEIKNVDQKFWKDWHNDDGELEAKNHIEMQCQWQMLVSGIDELYIGVLFGGNDWQVLHRNYDPVIGGMMLDAVREFWRKVDTNEQPKFDYADPRDQKIIQLLYREANPPKIMHAEDNGELATLYKSYRQSKKTETLEKAMADSLKARITTIVGDASEIYLGESAFTLKEQEYGDWTEFRLLEDGKTFDANSLPECNRLVIILFKGGELSVFKMDGFGVFTNPIVLGANINDMFAWMYAPVYKAKTVSRVLRDKKIKSLPAKSPTTFDAKID